MVNSSAALTLHNRLQKRVAAAAHMTAQKSPSSQEGMMMMWSSSSSSKKKEGMTALESSPKQWWPQYIDTVRNGLVYDLNRYSSTTSDPIEEIEYIWGQLLSYATSLRDAAGRVGAGNTTDLEIFWWRTKGAELATALAGVITNSSNNTVAMVEAAVNGVRSTFSRNGDLVVPTVLTGESESKTANAIAAARTAIIAAEAVAVYPEKAYEDYLLALKLAFETDLRATQAANMDNRVERQYWEQIAFTLAEEMYTHATAGSVELDAELVYWFKTQELEKMVLPLYEAVATNNKTVTEWRTIIRNLASATNTAALKTGYSASLVTPISVRTANFGTLKDRVDLKKVAAETVITAAPWRASIVTLLWLVHQGWAAELVSTVQMTDAARVAGWVEKAVEDARLLVARISTRGQPTGANAAETLWWMYCAADAARALVNQAKLSSATASEWRTAIAAWQADMGRWLTNGYVQEPTPRSYSALTTEITRLQTDINAIGSGGGGGGGGSGTGGTGTGGSGTGGTGTGGSGTGGTGTGGSGTGGTGTCDEDTITADRKRVFEQSAAQRREAELSVWRMVAFGGVALFLCALGAFLFGIVAFWAALAVLVTIGFGYAALERYQKIRDRDPGVFSQVNPNKLDPVPKTTASFTSGKRSETGGGGTSTAGRTVQAFFSGGEGLRATTARTSGAVLAQQADAKRRRVTRPAVMAASRPPAAASTAVAGFRAASADNACGCAAAATSVGNTRKTWIGDGW